MVIGALTALDLLSTAHGAVSAAVHRPDAQTESAASQAPVSFADALTKAARDTVGAMQKAEALSVAGLQGRADTREVVDAVMSAEQSLKAAISIRDKIVHSYLEISRMAI